MLLKICLMAIFNGSILGTRVMKVELMLFPTMLFAKNHFNSLLSIIPFLFFSITVQVLSCICIWLSNLFPLLLLIKSGISHKFLFLMELRVADLD